MALKQIRQCDVCQALIPEGARRFDVYIGLRMSNDHYEEVKKHVSDVCSEACLMKTLAAAVREVDTPPIAMTTEFILTPGSVQAIDKAIQGVKWPTEFIPTSADDVPF